MFSSDDYMPTPAVLNFLRPVAMEGSVVLLESEDYFRKAHRLGGFWIVSMRMTSYLVKYNKHLAPRPAG